MSTTPGPWKARRYNRGTERHSSLAWQVVDRGGALVADHMDERIAHQVASVPDMLAALEGLERYPGEENRQTLGFRNALRDCRAVLKLAKGEG